ncbi:hypothetical protein M9978_10720 [Sphingomonas sp. MG17]|jgi:hypothetical protein|uniref:Secreted protein n=1 Tax=Sphingomonas tagetis TaxID=2949092 RepID=A0A9X2KLS1_9SPHN|nr:hypothetical protein [Sphingomonas tagetis]MCP3730902.1 hypothetical protein [Sphingomonas tagetis]
MQKFTMKLWSAAGAAAAATTLAATPAMADGPAPTVADPTEYVYPAGFDKALSLMLAGEGGENGTGVQKVWPTLSVPALTTVQIQKAVTGNSLVIPYHYTHQYSADGKVGGYNIRYDKIDISKCPKKEIPGDGLLLYAGVCQAQVNEPVTGTWKAEDNKLCVDIGWAGKTQVTGCYNVFFVMDSVAMVKPDGSVSGKAHALKKGAAPDM